MMQKSCGLCFSILANTTTCSTRHLKVSLLQISKLEKQISPASFSFPGSSPKGSRLSQVFLWSHPPPAFLSASYSCSAVAFLGAVPKLLKMNPAKRPMEGGNSPPHKYRLLHCIAPEPGTHSNEHPPLDTNSAAPGSEECEKSSNVISPAKRNNYDKRKLNTAKQIRYSIADERHLLVKESLKEYKALIEKNGLLEEMNSKETTFGSRETVISGDSAAAAAATSLSINPNPVDPLDYEEEEYSDGLLNLKKKKKMFAVLLSYSGKGFLGLQNNPPHRTIEGELLKAMQSKDLITETECLKLQVVNFQRAARTDKGVSAAKQVISVRLPISDGQEEKVKEDLNAVLPPQIRIMDIRRATRSFNSKNWCDCRTYSYLAPSFAFAPLDQVTSSEFRISEAGLSELRRLMAKYVGTHNFHNFTIRKKPTEANAKRFIQLVEVDDPFVREDVEWILFKIRGQSFMMHQIRKMIGLVISICRGLVPASMMEESFTHAKIETPKAPGLGLVLEQPHYNIYNKRFGQDGTHKPIDWSGLEDKVAAFRRDYIDKDIITTELREHSMLEFLKILHLYSFTDTAPGPGIRAAHRLVTGSDCVSEDFEEDQLPADDDEDDADIVAAGTKARVSNTAKAAPQESKDAVNGHRENTLGFSSGKLDVPAAQTDKCKSLSSEDITVSHNSAEDCGTLSEQSTETEVSTESNLDATSRQNS